MRILNYYQGETNKLSGFVYDTEARTYKEFSVNGKDWVDTNGMAKGGFFLPENIHYRFGTKWEMESKLADIKLLHFTKDNTMVINFGILER